VDSGNSTEKTIKLLIQQKDGGIKRENRNRLRRRVGADLMPDFF
jgi:hypothetical protein